MSDDRTDTQRLLEGMMALHDEDFIENEPILQLGFGYPGNKADQLDNILPHIPRAEVMVDVCGGSGALLLNCPKAPLEVYNDRCSGVTAFYRCIQNRETLDTLKERISWMVYSKEEWYWCRDTWQALHKDHVERAARWFYTLYCSFGSRMQAWGRNRSGYTRADKFGDMPLNMEALHRRIGKWQIENDDFTAMFKRYDGPRTVFYVDPTYYDCFNQMYTHELSKEQHHKLLECIHSCQGYVALSGYPNKFYDTEYDWDNRIEWQHKKSMKAGVSCEANNFQGMEGTRTLTTEVLWIKEFN